MIQITEDPSAERTAPPRSTHVRDGRRLLRLDPARRKERLRKAAPMAARRRGVVGAAVLRQGFAKHVRRRRGVGEGRGCALDVLCSPPCHGFVTTDVLEKGLSRGAIATG